MSAGGDAADQMVREGILFTVFIMLETALYSVMPVYKIPD